jgi:hypothetical protein
MSLLALAVVGCCGFAGSVLAEDRSGDAPKPAPAPPRTSASKETSTRKAITTGKLSVDLKEVPFQEVLEMLASQARAGLALDGHITAETLRRPITLKLNHSSIYAVLHWIFRKRDLAWAVDGIEIVVGPPEFIDADIRNRQLEFVAQTEEKWRELVTPKLNETPMSVDVADVPLGEVLDLVAGRAALSVVWENDAEPNRSRRLSLKVDETPIPQILDKLAAGTGLTWSLEAEAVLISVAKP